MATRKEQYDATQSAIIEAGTNLLCQKEAKSVSISEIMKACGLSPGLFYHYYKSKDAFILSLITQNWEENMELLEDATIPPLLRPRAYCIASLHTLVDCDPQLHRNLNAYRMTDTYLRQRESRYEDDAMYLCLSRFFRRCIDQGVFAPELPVHNVVELYVYVVHGIDFNAALYKRPWSDWTWCDQFFSYVEQQYLKPYLLA